MVGAFYLSKSLFFDNFMTMTISCTTSHDDEIRQSTPVTPNSSSQMLNYVSFIKCSVT